MEFRIYNELNCSIFDLIGNKEPDQTKSLGYLLAKSPIAMKCFLQLMKFDAKEQKKLLNSNYRYVVNCELPQKIGHNKSYRADIIIRFFEGFIPKKAIVVEAKTADAPIGNKHATEQVTNYKNQFNLLQEFDSKEVIIATLTSVIDYNCTEPGFVALTWQNLCSSFAEYRIPIANSNEKKLIREFIYYINKIQKTMNYYDEEILSIPAGRTLDLVKKYYIYECPTTGKYKSRGVKHPLYVAFRAKGQHGRITHLYKIQDVLSFDFNDQDAINAIVSMGKYPDIENRIKGYKMDAAPKGQKYVFIIDKENTIELPYPVEYDGSIRGMAGTTTLKLSEVIRREPDENNIVRIKLKKDQTDKTDANTDHIEPDPFSWDDWDSPEEQEQREKKLKELADKKTGKIGEFTKKISQSLEQASLDQKK